MRKPLNAVLAALLTAGLLAGCGAKAAEPTAAALPTETTAAAAFSTETTAPAEPLSPAADILAGMTLRQKIGQLFIVRPDALDVSQTQTQIDEINRTGVTALTEKMQTTLEQYPVGGIAMFSKNITSPEQITRFNAALQEASAIPLFLAVDEEGGLVARLANHKAFDLPKYKNAAAVGASEDPNDALEMGSTIGAYLKEYGFNLNFAPVADINTNPDNTVIGSRAFSTSAETATQMAAAMAEGLNSQGIIATFKHFPGHGGTAEDSHISLAITYRTESQLTECEFQPFLKADKNDLIMVGHIAAPEVTGDLLPASMSGTMIGLLKNNLGFDGLVITDSLSMSAITEAYTSGEAAVTALQAGCDLLLMPHGMAEAFEAVVTAVEDGSLSQQWLDETVLRILEFKMLHGILKFGTGD